MFALGIVYAAEVDGRENIGLGREFLTSTKDEICNHQKISVALNISMLNFR